MHVLILGKKIPVIKKKLEDHHGLYDPVKKTIEIDTQAKGSELLDTHLHEFLHAYFDRMGMRNAGFSSELEEIICSTLPEALRENYKISCKQRK